MPASESIVTTVGDRTLTLTNLDKVLYPACGYAKSEVIAYYLAIADVMLPHLAGRCITRVRFPDGVDAQPFFEKNAPNGAPDWLTGGAFGLEASIAATLVLALALAALIAWRPYAGARAHLPSGAVPG